MNDVETAQVLGMLAGAYGAAEINDLTTAVWAEVLQPVQARHAQEVAALYIRTEKYFPTPAEFLKGVQELERRDGNKELVENSATASFRCDGSRWREHRNGTGMEPCPTCNPILYDRLSTDNLLWRNGKRYTDEDKLATVSFPACVPSHENQSTIKDTSNYDSDDDRQRQVERNRGRFHNGIEVAWTAYVEQCVQLGREPRERAFAKHISGMSPATPADVRDWQHTRRDLA